MIETAEDRLAVLKATQHLVWECLYPNLPRPRRELEFHCRRWLGDHWQSRILYPEDEEGTPAVILKIWQDRAVLQLFDQQNRLVQELSVVLDTSLSLEERLDTQMIPGVMPALLSHVIEVTRMENPE